MKIVINNDVTIESNANNLISGLVELRKFFEQNFFLFEDNSAEIVIDDINILIGDLCINNHNKHGDFYYMCLLHDLEIEFK